MAQRGDGKSVKDRRTSGSSSRLGCIGTADEPGLFLHSFGCFLKSLSERSPSKKLQVVSHAELVYKLPYNLKKYPNYSYQPSLKMFSGEKQF